MYCVISSYLTNRISASNVQFRAGSSFRGQGGTLHQAVQLIVHPLYDDWTIDFDVAVARVIDNVFTNLNFWQNLYKLGSNMLNETLNLVYNLKTLQLTAALTLRNTTNGN
jgi:hypothetical protein